MSVSFCGHEKFIRQRYLAVTDRYFPRRENIIAVKLTKAIHLPRLIIWPVDCAR